METTRTAHRTWAPLAGLLVALALLVPAGAVAAPGEVVHFPLPAGGEPEGIAAGPEGDLWFTERGGNRIGRINLAGQVTEYPVPTPASQPFQIAAGPDGNMWFTESNAGNIGRITPAGVIAEFNVCGYCRPSGITAGPDGNVWFTLPVGGGRVGNISPSGVITEFLLPLAPNEPRGITLAADGNLWITDEGLVGEEPSIGQIARVTPTGQVTAFRVPTAAEDFTPSAITAGPGGALWFAGSGVGLGRIDTAGAFTEFHVGGHEAITTGPDGNLWLTASGPLAADGSIDRVTTDGHLTTYAVPYGSRGIAVGADRNIWFTEWVGGGIGRITPGSPGPEVVSSQTWVRGRRAKVSLFCSGGSPRTSCAGRLALVARVRRKSPKDHGRVRNRKVQLGSSRYRIADGREGMVSLKLSRRKLELLPRKREVPGEAVVRDSDDAGASRTVALVFPRYH